MAIPFLNNITLNDYEIQNFKVHVSAVAPTAAKGQMYLNSVTNLLNYHNGTAWIPSGLLDLQAVTSLGSATTLDITIGQSLTFGEGGTSLLDGTTTRAQLTHAQKIKLTAPIIELPSDAVISWNTGGTIQSSVSYLNILSEGQVTISGKYGAQLPTIVLTTDGLGFSSQNQATTSRAFFKTTNVTAQTYFEIPNTTGTSRVIPISVNGYYADNAGLITVPEYVEVDTLDSVTGRGNVTTNDITVGDLIVSGDLTVNGLVTTVNTETINLADNIIVLNSNETAAPTQNAGIQIERGTSNNRTMQWNESTDVWEVEVSDGVYWPIVYDTGAVFAYKQNITVSSIITHSLNSRDLIIQLFDSVTYETVYADVVRTSVNTATVTFAGTPPNPIRVLVNKI
jgi:hypothetical protein